MSARYFAGAPMLRLEASNHCNGCEHIHVWRAQSPRYGTHTQTPRSGVVCSYASITGLKRGGKHNCKCFFAMCTSAFSVALLHHRPLVRDHGDNPVHELHDGFRQRLHPVGSSPPESVLADDGYSIAHCVPESPPARPTSASNFMYDQFHRCGHVFVPLAVLTSIHFACFARSLLEKPEGSGAASVRAQNRYYPKPSWSRKGLASPHLHEPCGAMHRVNVSAMS